MKVIVVKNASELGKRAFDLLAKAVDEGAKTLGLATGSSPVELYQEMVASQLEPKPMARHSSRKKPMPMASGSASMKPFWP